MTTTHTTEPGPGRVRLAGILATHTLHLIDAIRANASTGLPCDSPGMERAAQLLARHQHHLLSDDEPDGVKTLLDALSSAPSGPMLPVGELPSFTTADLQLTPFPSRQVTACPHLAPEPFRQFWVACTVEDGPHKEHVNGLLRWPRATASDPTPAPTAPTERRDRYAAAIREDAERPRDERRGIIPAVMAVADAEQAELRRELELAVAHDRQPYPTAWAYEQACKALRRKTEALEQVLTFAASLDDTARKLAGPDAVHPVAAHLRHLADTTSTSAQPRETGNRDEDETRISADGDGVLVHLPQVNYLDTQVWSVDIGLTPEALRELRDAATTHLNTVPLPAGQHGERRCPRCDDSLAGYADDDLVYLRGDDRPYCSHECVVAMYRIIRQAPADRACLDNVRGITRRLAAHAVGFQDVLDEGDAGAWGKTVGADIAALTAALATEQQPADQADDGEGDELVCVDQCGYCDACGMEQFGTPTEGWREAARFLRRTARTSGDRQGALDAARLIEAELLRMAVGAQPGVSTGDKALALGMTDAEYRARSHAAAVAAVRAAIRGMHAHVGFRLEDVLNKAAEPQGAAAPQPEGST
ncbi:hypothetical protein [Streptomyces fagopyri]|uniref:hypothetical protein n=1 Tax=Streptomyces fagopyri TaxID=2662397 RepID=UPI0037F3A53E